MCIRFWVRLSVILMPVSFNFFLFLTTVSNVIFDKLDDDRPWLFALFKFPIRCLRSISTSVSFSCKSSFKVSVRTISVSSYWLSFTPCTKMKFLQKHCSCLSMTLFFIHHKINHQFFYPSFLSIFFCLSIFFIDFSSSLLVFFSFFLLSLSNSWNLSL